jgi:hypothetical protein
MEAEIETRKFSVALVKVTSLLKITTKVSLFVRRARTFGEVRFDKNIPVIEFDIEERSSVFLLKFPCFRLTTTKFTKFEAHELAMHSVTFQENRQMEAEIEVKKYFLSQVMCLYFRPMSKKRAPFTDSLLKGDIRISMKIGQVEDGINSKPNLGHVVMHEPKFRCVNSQEYP